MSIPLKLTFGLTEVIHALIVWFHRGGDWDTEGHYKVNQGSLKDTYQVRVTSFQIFPKHFVTVTRDKYLHRLGPLYLVSV